MSWILLIFIIFETIIYEIRLANKDTQIDQLLNYIEKNEIDKK